MCILKLNIGNIKHIGLKKSICMHYAPTKNHSILNVHLIKQRIFGVTAEKPVENMTHKE